MSKTRRPNPHAAALAHRRWAGTTAAERSTAGRAAAIARHARREASAPPIEIPPPRYVDDVLGRLGAPAAGLPADPLDG